MLAFRYDKTFEGLLTSVFDAYSRKMFPDYLLSEYEPSSLFTQAEYTVVTATDKSARVWEALEKKLTKDVCSMLVHVWLSELPGSDELLFRYIRKAIDSPRNISTNFADNDIVEVDKIARKVSREGLHLIQFVRFQKTSDDLFFAPVSPVFNSLPLTMNYFTNRFADQKWLIYDIKRRYGFYYDLKIAEEVTLDNDEHLLSGKLNEELLSHDEQLFQQMWKSYFQSITIRERINLKLHRQHMPRRYWKFMPEKN
jgi:probable DNA metabolism protein